MKKLVFAIAAICAAVFAPSALAQYAPPALGIDRTVPTAAPVCIMSGSTCKVRLGVANLDTGALSDLVVASRYLSPAQIADIESYAGSLDLASSLNQIFNNNAGKTIILPAGKLRHTAHLVCPAGTTIEGVGWAELAGTTPSEPSAGTIFYQDYLAAADPKGIEATGTHCTIRNLEIRQPQPAPSTVGWTPRENPWAIYTQPALYSDTGGHRLTVDNVMLRNVTYGIFSNNARGGNYSNILGQPFKKGIYISGDTDVATLHNIQLGWTFWAGGNPYTYQAANLDAFTFGRVDNPEMTNIFSFGANNGMTFFRDTSHGNSDYDGWTSAAVATNVHMDACNECLLLKDNAEVEINGYYSSPSFDGAGQCIKSYGVTNPGADGENLRLTISGGTCAKPGAPAMIFAYDPPNTPAYPQYIKLTGYRITQPRPGATAWAPGNPAIATVSPQARVTAIDLTVDNVTDITAMVGGNTPLISRVSATAFQGEVSATDFVAVDTAPRFEGINTAAPSGAQRWAWRIDTSGTWILSRYADDNTLGGDAISVTQSGGSITGIALNVTTTAPTPSTGDNSTNVATTKFTHDQIGATAISNSPTCSGDSSAAIAAAISTAGAGGSVLIPANSCHNLTSAGVTGASGMSIGTLDGRSTLNYAPATGSALTTTAGLNDIGGFNIITTTPGNTATGLQLGVGVSDEAANGRSAHDIYISGFSTGIANVSGQGHQIGPNVIVAAQSIGLDITNPTCDAGDYGVTGFAAVASNTTAKLINWRCSGGGRFENIKLLGGAYGFYSRPEGITVDLQFSAVSIENQSVACWYFTRSAGGNWVGNVTIASSECAGVPTGIDFADAGVKDSTVSTTAFSNITSKNIHIGPGASNIVVGLNSYDLASPPIVDDRTNALDDRGYLDRRYTYPFYGISTTWTTLVEYSVPPYRAATIEFYLEGLSNGNDSFSRRMIVDLRNNGTTLVATTDQDYAHGVTIDVQMDVTTTPGTAYLQIRKNAGDTGTSLSGSLTQVPNGKIQSYKFR